MRGLGPGWTSRWTNLGQPPTAPLEKDSVKEGSKLSVTVLSLHGYEPTDSQIWEEQIGIFKNICLFIWLYWIFVASCRLLLCKDSSLVARELSSWQHARLVAVWTLVP